MTSAEATSKVFVRDDMPNYALNGMKMFYVECTTTNATDFLTMSQLATIKGVYLIASDCATVAAGSSSTNVFTFSNGATGTKVWSGLVWGV